MTQRPMHNTYGDLRISTPGRIVESQEEFGSCDVTELDTEDLPLMVRPSTPLPPDGSESDSDSDSDEDCSPIYSSSQISNLLSRRELEAMGIYPGDDEQDLTGVFGDGALEEISLDVSDNTPANTHSSALKDISEEDENSY